MLRDANMNKVAELWDQYVAMLEGIGDPVALQGAANAMIAGGLRDPEGLFNIALWLARFGCEDRAIEILKDVVARGYCPYETFRHNPWLDALRGRPAFVEIEREAKERHQDARMAFIQAGGEARLGVGSVAASTD
jgi:hypothetical protein